ncbi:hypothetical protein OHT57_41410 [Streptomyces sp. NBC_00285]|nr:hypothetical protein [Streptomyces sp. NBC_00285]
MPRSPGTEAVFGHLAAQGRTGPETPQHQQPIQGLLVLSSTVAGNDRFTP